MSGTFFAVSVGPGDKDLMTFKAAKIIESCNVIFTPITSKGATVALDIAKNALGEGTLRNKNVLKVDVPMINDRKAVYKRQLEIARECEAYLYNGHDLAFLTLGDVSLYSSAAQIADIVKKDGYNVVYCAGVTSISASSAILSTSLIENDEMLTVIPADSAYKQGWLEKALNNNGTKVLMKLGRSFPAIIKVLEKMSLLEKSILVSNCGLEDEKVLNLKDFSSSSEELLSKLFYFSLIIIKDKNY